MRSQRSIPATPATPANPIPFPGRKPAEERSAGDNDSALEALNIVSRKLEDLARQLNCLGFFDEPDPDRPRAA